MINVEWCSFCAGKPSVGNAQIDDGSGTIMEIGLCADCYRKVAPPLNDISIAWDNMGG